MYKPLLINVSVSLIVSGVQPHMTDWLKFPNLGLELDLEKGLNLVLGKLFLEFDKE